MEEFKLSAVLVGHNSDVRAVLLPDPKFAITASRDGTTRIWKQTATSPPMYDDTESSHGAMFKTCLSYVPPVKGYPDGLIISSGQDALIEARQPGTTANDNAEGLMVGHGHQVCSLDVNSEAGWIVSGSWDGTARLWQIGRWEPELELQGHTGSVWAVVAYSNDFIVTGCADQAIRIFDLRGKLMNSFHGKDVVRALARLPKGHESGGDLVSATNDGVIRTWTIKGEQIMELHGHEAFIYSLAVLPSGEILSSGEDRSVRIWKGSECVQVITLPAISVWSVAACPNGDIITGSSDKLARIFTRDQSRLADEAVIKQFQEEVKSSTIPQQQMGELNVTDAPGPDFLKRKSGTKEGQTQLIKESNGSIGVYQWSISQQAWVSIGQAVGSTGSSSTKKIHNGKEYDYVFDINIEDGKPDLKLPYNVTQNPYDAATKFLTDNELPMTYLEETANWIIQNTQGATLGQTAQTGPDAWGTESRYRPDDNPSTSSYQPPPPTPTTKKLPQKTYVSIAVGKPEAAQGQIIKLNTQYAASGNTTLALAPSELDLLSQLSTQLARHNFAGQSSLRNSTSLQAGMAVAVKVATQWQPPSNRLAGLDLLRFLAAAATELPQVEFNALDVVSMIAGGEIFSKEILSTSPKLAMVAIRFFTNLFYGSESGRELIEAQYDLLIGHVKSVSSMVASDVPLAIAISTFYLNLAVYITGKDFATRHDVASDRGLTIIEETVKILSSFPKLDPKLNGPALQQVSEPAYRGVAALGTVLTGLQSEEVTMAATQIFGVREVLDQLRVKGQLRDPRIQALVPEVRAALA